MNYLRLDNFKILILDEIDSTNSECKRLINNNLLSEKNYIIIAKKQTSGRGRNNKFWHSEEGNLYCSIIMQHELNLTFLHELSFVISIALRKTIISIIGKSSKSIQTKWPNDILVDGKKISGILIENIQLNNNNYIIIGIGINILHHPTNINQLTTCLKSENLSINIDNYKLLKILIKNLNKYFSIWQKNGFSYIKDIWVQNAYKLGKKIQIKNNGQIFEGIFVDIDDDGSIILFDENKKTYNKFISSE